MNALRQQVLSEFRADLPEIEASETRRLLVVERDTRWRLLDF